ncbi:MAG: hypothetical protein QXL51_03970 [Candidatus Aenigmatarchaeota archaeon]
MAQPLIQPSNAGDEIQKLKQVAKIIYPNIYTKNEKFSELDAQDVKRELQYLPQIINLLEWALRNVNKLRAGYGDELRYYDDKTGNAIRVVLCEGRGSSAEVVPYPNENTIYILACEGPVVKVIRNVKRALKETLARYTKAQQILH